MEERSMIQQGDTSFGKFVMDSTQDAEVEKLIDNLIDEKMLEGKTDEQILAELGAITGMTSDRHAKTP